MFGTTKMGTITASSRRSSTNSKPAAYYAARAIDEALGGLLRANATPTLSGQTVTLLANVTAERYWTATGMTEELGRAGRFQISTREVARIIGDEEQKTRRGETRVQRGPGDNFESLVRAEWEKIRNILDNGPEALPAEWFYRLRFWNEKSGNNYAKDVPNPTREEEIGIPAAEIAEKNTNTVAVVEYIDPDDETRQQMFNILKANLLSEEDIIAYRYRVPIKLLANEYVPNEE